MKPDTHPAYGPVVSHPWWTGTGRVMDTAGRVERSNQRYGRATATGSTGTDAS